MGGESFTYYGSMIQLYNSRQAIGIWGSNNVYSAPNRAWFFDKRASSLAASWAARFL